MDEAFLRRVRFKVHVPDPTPAQYKEIWRRVCRDTDMRIDEALIDRLLQRAYHDKGRALHGSHPRDLLSHVVHSAHYLGRPAQLTQELLDVACETYFVEADEG
jgi:SpoVK/Ycf46/Vps4 family AAA+-type ATPase